MLKKSLPAAAIMAALALAALALDKGFPIAPAAQEAKPAFRLGVVNLKTCFDKEKYDRIKEVEEELKKLADEYKKQVEDLQKKEDTLKEHLKGLDPRQSLYQEKLFQLRRTQNDLKLTQEIGKARITEHYTDAKRAVFNEIQRVVDLVGKDQKFDLILRVEEPQLQEQDEINISTQIISRVVLYANETVDITQMVLKRLNEEHKKQRGGGGDKGEKK
jgi:Skp family chaperone for outer membrane proteins